MDRMTFAVIDDATPGKTTSSWWAAGLNLVSNILAGVSIFKSSVKNQPLDKAIPASAGMSREQFDARLRLDGINPDAYYKAVEKNLPAVDSASTADINQALAISEMEAADPGQKQWLWLALGLIMLLGLGGAGRGRGRRTRSMFVYRSRRRRRGRRRGRR